MQQMVVRNSGAKRNIEEPYKLRRYMEIYGLWLLWLLFLWESIRYTFNHFYAWQASSKKRSPAEEVEEEVVEEVRQMDRHTSSLLWASVMRLAHRSVKNPDR